MRENEPGRILYLLRTGLFMQSFIVMQDLGEVM